MSKVTFVGDVHALDQAFRAKASAVVARGETVIQVGDMGLGFNGETKAPGYGPGVYFIRGNHDNPDVCRNCPNYLGDYGYSKTLNLFYVSGAWSIDASMRRPFWSWWPEEELSMPECSEALTLWEKTKPDFVVTHDAPAVATRRILHRLGGLPIPTRMGQLFDQMFHGHKPKLWVFGHWHVPFDEVIDGTRFVCLPELGVLTVDLSDFCLQT